VSHARADALEALLDERYSCRGYLADAVPRAIVERILAQAQRTASWCNSQPWRVHITAAPATERLRESLLAYMQEHEPGPDFAFPCEYRGIYQDRRRECGLQLYQATGVARGDRHAAERQRMENFRFFGAPHVAVVSTEESLGVYGAIDCGAYAQNFMLAARAHGVACIAQAALALYPQFWREQFGLAADRRVVCGISFGYEDAQHSANAFRTTRASVPEVAQWLE
jgi:nitroreductase